MADNINPILNGPYTEPKHYYRTLPDGTLDYTKKEKGRRPYDPTINTPIPVKQGSQGAIFDQQQTINRQIESHIINLIRKEVKDWRDSGYVSHAPTQVNQWKHGGICFRALFSGGAKNYMNKFLNRLISTHLWDPLTPL